MASLTVAHGNNILDASLGTASFTATTTPLKARLMTANGNGTTAGTEVTGGSYTAQNMAFSSAASLSTSNSATVNYANMPACTVVGVELWDSSGSPVRKHYGALAASKTVNAGDTFSFASGAVIVNFS